MRWLWLLPVQETQGFGQAENFVLYVLVYGSGSGSVVPQYVTDTLRGGHLITLTQQTVQHGLSAHKLGKRRYHNMLY